MGTRGPVRKRSEERIRRNKESESGIKTDTVEMIGEVDIPDLNLPTDEVNPLVYDLWKSLPDSGQVKYWEPSDWNYARIVMFAINELLGSADSGKGMSAMKISAIDTMMSKLLLTEGDRRRVKLEVQRTEAEAKLVNAEDLFRQRFEAMRVAND